MKACHTSLAIIASILASPAIAATDGTLGPTSNASFNVTANISAPAVDSVHVFGLEDFVLTGNTGETVATETSFFCMIRSPNSGDIGVTISSIAANDTSFVIRKQNDELPLAITIQFDSGVQYTQLFEGNESVFSAPSTCTGTEGPTTARMDATIQGPPEVAGAYSNTFLISIAPK